MLFFIKCSKDLNDPDFDIYAAPAGKGKPSVEVTNNLSFPAIAVDGFTITPPISQSLTVQYTGDYPELTAEEIAALQASGPWYAQKTTGNVWQAEVKNQGNEDVTYIDWGDNIESVYPKIRSPFRLEVTLYKALDDPMTAYTIEMLEYPSSSTELQVTNTTTYENSFATVISARPQLVIQYLGTTVPADMTWSTDHWTSATTLQPVNVSFAPELNVAGKYVYGASSGGWKPASTGYYRITFYVPNGSGVNLASASIANASNDFAGSPEGTAATPVVDTENNLTYMVPLIVARVNYLSFI